MFGKLGRLGQALDGVARPMWVATSSDTKDNDGGVGEIRTKGAIIVTEET